MTRSPREQVLDAKPGLAYAGARGKPAMRRWKRLAILGVVLIAVCVLAFWPRPQPLPITSISRETFHRIKLGMQRAEVLGILGPPGLYCTRETEHDPTVPDEDFFTLPPPNGGREVWDTDTATVFVGFDQAGAVDFGAFSAARPSTKTTWRKLRERVGRLLREWFPLASRWQFRRTGRRRH